MMRFIHINYFILNHVFLSETGQIFLKTTTLGTWALMFWTSRDYGREPVSKLLSTHAHKHKNTDTDREHSAPFNSTHHTHTICTHRMAYTRTHRLNKCSVNCHLNVQHTNTVHVPKENSKIILNGYTSISIKPTSTSYIVHYISWE